MDSPNPTPDLKEIRRQLEGGRVTMTFEVEISLDNPPRVYLNLPRRWGGNAVVDRPGEVLVMSLLMQALTGEVDGECWVHVSAYHRRCDVDRVPEEIPTTGGMKPRFPDAIILTRKGSTGMTG